MRDAVFGRFNGESLYFGFSDRMRGDGDTKAAAGVITGGIRYAPQNAALWTELGNVLAIHDHAVSPASLFAFQQTMRLAPTHPWPAVFLGWAYIRSGQLAEAQPFWARALALTPRQASYRAAIADRLAALDGFLAAGAPPRRCSAAVAAARRRRRFAAARQRTRVRRGRARSVTVRRRRRGRSGARHRVWFC